MKTLYLCGAGNPEGVRLAIRINEKQSRWDKIILLDDDPQKHGKLIVGIEIVGPFEMLEQADVNSSEVVNLVARTTAIRRSALQKIKKYDLPFAPLIDPDVDTFGVEYSNDIIVYPNATFAAAACVDEATVVFMGAIVGHRCSLNRCCVVGPGAVINARVQVGEGVYIGTNASILPDLKIGPWATVGINSAVVQDVPAGATVMGVPAEILFTSREMLDGDAQPETEQGKHKDEAHYVSPGTEVEEVLADMWAKLLQLEQIGVKDNIFDRGAKSLSTVQIAFQIGKAFNVTIPLQVFFDFPTIEEFAEKLEEMLLEQTDSAELERMLNEVENLSDEEAKKKLTTEDT